MVIPPSASSAQVAVSRTPPATSCAMIPAAATSDSVKVDFPGQEIQKPTPKGFFFNMKP